MKFILSVILSFTFMYSECINVGSVIGDNHNLSVERCTDGIRLLSSNGVKSKTLDDVKIKKIKNLLDTVQFGETVVSSISLDLMIKSRSYSSAEYFLIFDMSNYSQSARVWIPYKNFKQLSELLSKKPNTNNKLQVNGVTFDSSSKLMYQDNSDSAYKKLNWDNSISYCKNLKLAGYTDWKLPTVSQLESSIKNIVFKKVNSAGYYWTSTEYGSTKAMVVDAQYLSSTYSAKSYARNVRCVRYDK